MKIKKKSNENKEEEEENADETEKKDAVVDPNVGDEPPIVEHILTELDRLAWTIHKMNDECQIVPQNALCLTSQKMMEKNVYFKGLSIHESKQLSSYLHFRNPKDPYAISKFRKIGASNETDFLDPITNDLPHGCWILKSYKQGLMTKIHNLLWPGFEFYYEAGSSTYQQGYFGYGIRRNDLVFLL
jgi:radial spoke head protein 9